MDDLTKYNPNKAKNNPINIFIILYFCFNTNTDKNNVTKTLVFNNKCKNTISSSIT